MSDNEFDLNEAFISFPESDWGVLRRALDYYLNADPWPHEDFDEPEFSVRARADEILNVLIDAQENVNEFGS